MQLYYEESGNRDASLMVFLHGGGVSSWMWKKQIEYFSHYHCVAIDLPEQGKSKDVGHFTIKSSAEIMIKLIEKIAHGKKIIIIGFSLGAQVAIQMVSMKPNLIDYAMINSALVKPNSFAKKLIRPSIKMTYPLIKYKSFSKLQAKTLYIDHEFFDIYYKESSQMKVDTLIRILEENMSFSIPNDFTKTKANMLVTVGDKEKRVMKKSAYEIVTSNANCLGITIPKVGHGISLANPDLFNHIVDMWLQQGVLPDGIQPIT